MDTDHNSIDLTSQNTYIKSVISDAGEDKIIQTDSSHIKKEKAKQKKLKSMNPDTNKKYSNLKPQKQFV